jgi:ABC-type phosphate transport system substrate-binding protein
MNMKKLLSLIAIVISVMSVHAQVSVIGNKSVGEAVNTAKVISIYSLTTTKWGDGTKIAVFDNGSDANAGFYSALGKDHMSFKKEWMKKQLTGEAKAPENLGSDADVVAKVGSTPGAVGFVKSSSVTGAVKVLLELK